MSSWQLTLDREDFLATYWQRKPLLIRNAIAGFESPLDANELAGLALEEGVEARIVEMREQNWHLSHGPFAEEDFSRNCPWTLLVQAVDHYVDEVAQLRKLVDFIPQWRVDDIMISYAVDGGSVGPHYDNYDVFLLQAQGQRHWQLGPHCDDTSPLLDNGDLRILKNFACEAQYTLSAGDILYVPPGVAHWGIAQGECMTYSIGFRAPSISELLSRGVDALLEDISPERFYADPVRTANFRPGEIRKQDSDSAKAQLMAALSEQVDAAWFGELVTEAKYPNDNACADEVAAVEKLRDPAARLELAPEAKLAWQQNSDAVAVFANGETLRHGIAVLPVVIGICESWTLEGKALAEALDCPECAILVEQLMELRCLELE